MKQRLLFFITAFCFFQNQNRLFAAGGYAQQIQLTNQQIAASNRYTAASSTSSTDTSSNACSTTTDAATSPLPTFVISLWNSSSTTTPINSISFPTNQVNGSGGFLVSSALLTVHIFPPSNIITSSGITTPGTNSYDIMYTLKSLGGNTIQKVLQTITPTAGSTPASSVMPITKGIPTIPTSISISTIPQPTNPPSVTPPTQTQILAPVAFLPNLSTSSAVTQQRILNAISPLSQKFLITNGGSTITPISGTVDTDDSGNLVSSYSGASKNISATSGTTAQSITVTLSDSSGNPLSTQIFAQKNFSFNTQDLSNGLALNVHIFPPTTGSSTADYFAFATLKTLDGLKLHKLQFPAFSSQPIQLSINYGSSSTAQFSTLFVNSSISTQAFNLISPINLRCLLQSSAGIVTISMM